MNHEQNLYESLIIVIPHSEQLLQPKGKQIGCQRRPYLRVALIILWNTGATSNDCDTWISFISSIRDPYQAYFVATIPKGQASWVLEVAIFASSINNTFPNFPLWVYTIASFKQELLIERSNSVLPERYIREMFY